MRKKKLERLRGAVVLFLSREACDCMHLGFEHYERGGCAACACPSFRPIPQSVAALKRALDEVGAR